MPTAWPTDYSTGADVNAHANIEAVRRAIRERHWAIGEFRWPGHNNVWDEGTIEALTDIGDGHFTMLDSTKHWIITDTFHTAAPRWTEWDNEYAPYIPERYDLILNCDDPDLTKQIHLHITGNTENTLAIGTPIDWVTAGWIESIDDLVGTRYAIIKRDGLWWGERWPDQPNDDELWHGSDGAGAASIVVVDSATWTDGAFAGKTFRQAGQDDIGILANGKTYMVLARLDSPRSGSFKIVDGSTELLTATISSFLDGIQNATMKLKGEAVTGADLLIYAGPRVKRIVILWATSTVIAFTRQAAVVDGVFSIVRTGDRAWPARKPWPVHQWYGGALLTYYTHGPDDKIFDMENALSVTRMPATSVTYSSGEDPLYCEDISPYAFDMDLWSSLTEECSEADLCRSPHLFKTWRGLQNEIVAPNSTGGLCVRFVPTGDYDGATVIPIFSPATLFERAEINFVGRFTATSNADGDFTFTYPAQPGPCYWTVLRANGEEFASGYGGEGGSLSFTIGGDSLVYTLVLALGWTRYVPREFRYAYPRSAFIPDIMTDEFGNKSTIVPPTFEYPGEWIDRTASTNYKTYEPYGFGVDGGATFEAGARARYVGDNWGDPGITPQASVDSDGPLDTRYWRNFWEGKFRKNLRPLYEAKKKGVVEFGDREWFRAKEMDWWAVPVGLGSPMRTESGTATGGGTATLTITTPYYTPTATEDDPFPDDEPVPYFTGNRFVDMMLEVPRTLTDASGASVSYTYHTPITVVAWSETTVTITFKPVPAFTIAEIPATDTTPLVPAISVPALAVASGNAFAIKEPAYRRNWFAGRTVRITSPSGSVATRTITHHDATTMWLDSAVAFDIAAGSTWQIEELKIGHVYVNNGAAGAAGWDTVTGTTHAGNELLPKNDKRYGPVMAGDYLGGHVYQELYKAINLLVWTRGDMGWTAKGEVNSSAYSVPAYLPGLQWSESDSSISEAASNLSTIFSEKWNDPDYYDLIFYAGSDAAPFSLLSSTAGTPTSLSGYAWISGVVGRSYAYPKATISARIMSCTVAFFAHSVIVASDPEEGVTGTWPEVSEAHFDAPGPLQWRKWAQLDEIGPSDVELRVSDTLIGPTDMSTPMFQTLEDPLPHAVLDPGDAEAHAHNVGRQGFYINDSCILMKWDVPGGMTYLAE